jgi:hypothetical protein
MHIAPSRAVVRFLLAISPLSFLAITACGGTTSNPTLGCVAQPVASGSCQPGERACPASTGCQPSWSCDSTHHWTEAIPNCFIEPGLSRDAGSEPEDAGVPPADAGFPCGSQPGLTCGAQQYCLVGCTSEGPIVCGALLDSGECPSGSSLTNVCSSDAPCQEDIGPPSPTMCFDDLDASPCGLPDPASALEGRTIYCACTL